MLIDEYDAPLTACLTNPELFTPVLAELKKFYALVEAHDACLRFAFITGITRLKRYGDFLTSGFTDISRRSEWSTLVGFTENDIVHYFGGYIRQAAVTLNLTESVVHNRLRESYAGYSFDEAASIQVYSTWSTLNFFRYPSRGYKSYWTSSGGKLTMLHPYLQNLLLQTPVDYGKEKIISRDALKSLHAIDNVNNVALLIQAGYLTIKRFDGERYAVGYILIEKLPP